MGQVGRGALPPTTLLGIRGSYFAFQGELGKGAFESGSGCTGALHGLAQGGCHLSGLPC